MIPNKEYWVNYNGQAVQLCVFPMEKLQMTQDIGGTYSHEGTLAMDCVGDTNRTPLYASCNNIYEWIYAGGEQTGNEQIFQSERPVLTPSGLKYVRFLLVHGNDPLPKTVIGSYTTQGDLWYYTGTARASGDHVHINVGDGQYDPNVFPLVQNQYGVWELINEANPVDIFFVNDTQIVQGYSHNWQTYSGTIYPDEQSAISGRIRKRKMIYYLRRRH